MKLNKYIYAKLKEGNEDYMGYEASEEDIEGWIIDWYKDTFQEIGLGNEGKAKARSPPMWLAGPRWYNRRDEKIKEAQLKDAETRSHELDEA